jgi:hypothetical protein
MVRIQTPEAKMSEHEDSPDIRPTEANSRKRRSMFYVEVDGQEG